MREIVRIFGLGLLGCWVLGSAAAAGGPKERGVFSVVGYVPDYRVSTFRAERAQGLTDLIYFSLEPAADGGLLRRAEAVRDLRVLRREPVPQGLRWLVCVGGWERSKAFPSLAANPAARGRFVGELLKFCGEAGVQGVDLDWEHPGTPQAEQDYARLLAELERAFAPRKLLVTVALAGWQTLPPEGVQAVHRIHSMAYDAEGDHATMAVAISAVAKLREAGVPAEKICLGVPFYGRQRRAPRAAETYAELVRKYQPAPGSDEVVGYCFNGVETIRRKTAWARREHLGGLMIWEIGQDAAGEKSLLRALQEAVHP